MVSGPRVGSLNPGETEARAGLQGALAGQACIWFILEFPCLDRWHRQLLGRSWLRSVNASGKVLLRWSETQLDHKAPTTSSPSQVTSQRGQRSTGPGIGPGCKGWGNREGSTAALARGQETDLPRQLGSSIQARRGASSSASPGAPHQCKEPLTPLTAASPEERGESKLGLWH